MKTTTFALLAVTAAMAAGGCTQSKSSSPLSPSVAGPIPGVQITAPKVATPSQGAQIDVSSQPVTVSVENSTTTGQRPLNYLFEIALDADFTNKVLSRDGITPGDGRTSFRLPEALTAERTYYWRARAQDGANTGPYSAGSHFSVYTPVVLQAPGLQEPVGDVRLAGRTPTFRVSNAGRSGPVTSIVYEFQVATDEAFSQMTATLEQGEQVGSTRLVYPGDLAYGTRYFWRVRAHETSRNVVGPWSATAAFQTAAAPVVPAPLPPPPSTGCPADGRGLVECVMAKYPAYLAAGVSSSQRRANMEFLRDRTIEEGLCAGMRVGYNLKRGGPELSVDYVTYFTGGRWVGVDIARDYDNTSIRLEMTWFEAPDDPYATHADYTRSFSCR